MQECTLEQSSNSEGILELAGVRSAFSSSVLAGNRNCAVCAILKIHLRYVATGETKMDVE